MIISLALPSMRADLGISVVQGGLLATATLLGIGASSVTVGRIADRHSRKIALPGSLTLFGVCARCWSRSCPPSQRSYCCN
ncbi:MFS transporter [Nocardia gamkensis]|uniref:MFS transporter n=1 Tax=Nocardia gamkensis TaxID=352869 RepID=A0A7X6R7D7_9NOCA|nr:MFS transporter [Nocardia gamkensis]